MDKYLQVKDLKWWKKPLEKSLRFQGTKKKQCFCQAAVAFASLTYFNCGRLKVDLHLLISTFPWIFWIFWATFQLPGIKEAGKSPEKLEL
jgi:hypothetical protein